MNHKQYFLRKVLKFQKLYREIWLISRMPASGKTTKSKKQADG